MPDAGCCGPSDRQLARRSKPAQAAFTAVAEAIAAGEPVTVGASAGQYQNARARLPPAVRVVEITSNDAWMRDSGPTLVVDAAGVDGASIGSSTPGAAHTGGSIFPGIATRSRAKGARDRGLGPIPHSFVLEGGAMHVDGQGTCLTTEECLLNPNRNPGLARAEIEAKLRLYLGVRRSSGSVRRVSRRDRRPHRRTRLFHEPG